MPLRKQSAGTLCDLLLHLQKVSTLTHLCSRTNDSVKSRMKPRGDFSVGLRAKQLEEVILGFLAPTHVVYKCSTSRRVYRQNDCTTIISKVTSQYNCMKKILILSIPFFFSNIMVC